MSAATPMVAPIVEYIRRTTAAVERETDRPRLLRAVSDALKPLLRDGAWLPPEFAAAHPDHYQQYLLYCDPFERFSIVSFVWGPGQQTPIHDHMTWGVVGQLKGREVSTNYRYGKDGRLEVSGMDSLAVGQTIAFSPEQGDIHQVVNSSDDRRGQHPHLRRQHRHDRTARVRRGDGRSAQLRQRLLGRRDAELLGVTCAGAGFIGHTRHHLVILRTGR